MRSAGARILAVSSLYRYIAPLERKRFMPPLWGFGWLLILACYTHAAPLGLWLLGHAARLYTCRPSGAKCTNNSLSRSYHISPLWGFGYNTLCPTIHMPPLRGEICPRPFTHHVSRFTSRIDASRITFHSRIIISKNR